MERETSEQILQYRQEVQEHHQAATYKIWAYYHEPEVSEYESAPHDQQLKQAAAYIDLTITKVGPAGDGWKDRDVSIEWHSRREWSRGMAEDLLYGVALELIISAVHLKLDPRNFITYMAKNAGEMPYIGDSREFLEEDLARDIPGSHLDEINATLDFAKMKRNNLAHSSYHYHGGPNFSMLFITVAGYLIDRYADTTDITELEIMAEYLDELEQGKHEAEVYPELSVDFRPVT